jgi:hypothetical protein
MVDVKLLGQRFRFSDRTRPPATAQGRADLAAAILKAKRKAEGVIEVDDDELLPPPGTSARAIIDARKV